MNKFNMSGKRKKCAEIIAEMADRLSFPEEAVEALDNGLDLRILTDKQIDEVYAQLIRLTKQCSLAEMARRVKEGKTAQN